MSKVVEGCGGGGSTRTRSSYGGGRGRGGGLDQNDVNRILALIPYNINIYDGCNAAY
jgi:hypothetical protein